MRDLAASQHEVVVAPERLCLRRPARGATEGHGAGRLRPRQWERSAEPAEPLRRRTAARCGSRTLLFDLLTDEEARDHADEIDVEVLAVRLLVATRWVRRDPACSGLPVSATSEPARVAGAALLAAAEDRRWRRVVVRGGRPDLAGGAAHGRRRAHAPDRRRRRPGRASAQRRGGSKAPLRAPRRGRAGSDAPLRGARRARRGGCGVVGVVRRPLPRRIGRRPDAVRTKGRRQSQKARCHPTTTRGSGSTPTRSCPGRTARPGCGLASDADRMELRAGRLTGTFASGVGEGETSRSWHDDLVDVPDPRRPDRADRRAHRPRARRAGIRRRSPEGLR